MIQHIRTPLPVQYSVTDVVQCDACGIQDTGRHASLQGGPMTLMPPFGWFTGYVSNASGNVSAPIDADERVDYCPDCFPTVQKAMQQAAKALAAAKVAAKVAVHAEAHGVTV